MVKSTPRELVRVTEERLLAFYGEPEQWKTETAIDTLVAVILSQNTSDKNSFAAFASLKKAFPVWQQVLDAPESKIADAIKHGGLANIKTKRIKEVLAEIKARTGKLEIDFLKNVPKQEASAFLQSLKGVGPKSAAVVLSFALNKPAFPVDTHIYRVCKRLGLISEKTTREAAHDQMESLVADEKKLSYHLNLIKLGREICHARNPNCAACPLKQSCSYYKKVYKIKN